jgi:hypothetical protein
LRVAWRCLAEKWCAGALLTTNAATAAGSCISTSPRGSCLAASVQDTGGGTGSTLDGPSA